MQQKSAGDGVPVRRPASVWSAMPPEFRGYLLVSLALNAMSLLYVLAEILWNPAPHHGLPYDIYTRTPFEDMDAFVSKVRIVHSPDFFLTEWKYLYPAPVVLLYKFFSVFNVLPAQNRHLGSYLALFLIVVVTIAIMGVRLSRELERRGIAAGAAAIFVAGSAVLSWPIFYALHQGNLEAVLWLGVAAAIWAYWRGKFWTAAILLGVFGAFKIYPLLFLALFLPARRYAQLVTGLFVFALLTLVSLWYIGPTVPIAYHYVSMGVATFNAIGLSAEGVIPSSKMFDHSYCGLLHWLLHSRPLLLAAVLRHYMVTAAILATGLFFGRVWKMPPTNQVLFLALAAVSLPTTSFDYTLELLYVPWAAMSILAASAFRNGERVPGLLPSFLCLAILNSAVLFVRWHNLYVYGQMKAMVILVATILSVAYRFEIRSAAGKLVQGRPGNGETIACAMGA